MSTPSIAERLERLPFSAFHYRIFAMGALGYLFETVDGVTFAFALPVLRTEWQISPVQIGVLASAQAIGYLIGALASGALGDTIGRRPVMMWGLAIFTVATMFAALAPTWQIMFSLRVLEGVGAGVESVIVTPYLLEFCPTQYRGRFAGGLASFFGLGNLVSALIGFTVVPLAPWAWRAALIVCALPIFILLWWRRSLQESPRWLESRGRTAEAEAIMDQVEAEIIARHGALPPVTNLPAVPVPPRIGQGNILRNLAVLWGPQLIRVTAMTWILWFAVSFSFWAFTNWIPSLLVASGMTITRGFAYSVGIYAVTLPGYLTAAYLNDRVGRRATITVFVICSGLAAIGMALAHGEAFIFVAGMVLAFFMNGSYGGVYAYTPEVYPTDLRTTGTGAASAFSRIGSIVSPILVGIIFPAAGLLGVFAMIAAVLALGALGVIFLGVATSGRSLEQITMEELGAPKSPATSVAPVLVRSESLGNPNTEEI